MNLTDANDGWDGAPLYSPDGRWIAYLSQATPGYESDLVRLAVSTRGKTVRYATDEPDFDDWVDDMRWSPDSAAIVVPGGGRRGGRRCYRLDADRRHRRRGGAHRRLPRRLGARPPTALGVYTRRAIGAPPEVYRGRLGGGGRRAG